MEGEDHRAVLASLLDRAPEGLDLSKFAANRNLTAEEAAEAFAAVPMRSVVTSAGMLGFSMAYWEKLKAAALEAVAASHRRAPDGAGLAEDRLLSESGMRLPREVAAAVAAELASEGRIVRESSGVRLPSHPPQLNPADAALWKSVVPLLEEDLLRPPTVHEIATSLGEDPKKTEAFLGRAARLGLVMRVSQNRFFLPESLRRLRKIAEDAATESKDNLVTAGAFRDRAKIGRTVAIEVLEFFDRQKVMRRIGDGHQVIATQGEQSARPI
jgi:selenocysteine-specific elongation factor